MGFYYFSKVFIFESLSIHFLSRSISSFKTILFSLSDFPGIPRYSMCLTFNPQLGSNFLSDFISKNKVNMFFATQNVILFNVSIVMFGSRPSLLLRGLGVNI